MKNISFRSGDYSFKEISDLIHKIDPLFKPPLSKRTNLKKVIKKLDERGSFELAYTKQGKLIGCVAYYKNDHVKKKAYISILSVLPEYQGKGIASVLLDRCIENCKKAEMQTIILQTEESNESAKYLYKTKGFRIVSESTSENKWDRIKLIKNLT